MVALLDPRRRYLEKNLFLDRRKIDFRRPEMRFRRTPGTLETNFFGVEKLILAVEKVRFRRRKILLWRLKTRFGRPKRISGDESERSTHRTIKNTDFSAPRKRFLIRTTSQRFPIPPGVSRISMGNARSGISSVSVASPWAQ